MCKRGDAQLTSSTSQEWRDCPHWWPSGWEQTQMSCNSCPRINLRSLLLVVLEFLLMNLFPPVTSKLGGHHGEETLISEELILTQAYRLLQNTGKIWQNRYSTEICISVVNILIAHIAELFTERIYQVWARLHAFLRKLMSRIGNIREVRRSHKRTAIMQQAILSQDKPHLSVAKSADVYWLLP